MKIIANDNAKQNPAIPERIRGAYTKRIAPRKHANAIHKPANTPTRHIKDSIMSRLPSVIMAIHSPPKFRFAIEMVGRNRISPTISFAYPLNVRSPKLLSCLHPSVNLLFILSKIIRAFRRSPVIIFRYHLTFTERFWH